jgi:hypothetical protein
MNSDLDYDIFFGNDLARRKIAKKLNFDYNLGIQDWEYEVSHIRETKEYIELYDSLETSDEEKKCLMEMIIDSIEDKESENALEKHRDFILGAINNNLEIHKGTLVYWIEHEFLVSENLMEIVKELGFEKKIKWRYLKK